MAEDTFKLSDLKEHFLECSVCLEHFDQAERRPRLLVNCLHAFCTQCLEQLLQKEGRGQVTCPNCRQVQEVKGSAQSLAVDPVRNKLVDYVQFKRGKTIPCTDCPDGSHAVARCHDCQSYMCMRCKEAHHRNRLSRKHTCQSLKEALSEPVKNFLSHFCKDHPDHKIEFYCEQCSSLCCVSCFIWKHKGHDLVPIEDAAISMLSSLKTKMKDVDRSASVLKRKTNSLDRESTQQELNLIQLTDSINKTFDVLVCKLNCQRNKLTTQLKERTESTLNGLKKQREASEDTLAQMESALEYFKQMESKADDCEVLSAGPVLIKSLEAAAVLDQTQDVQHQTCIFEAGEIITISSNAHTLGEIKSVRQRPTSRPFDMESYSTRSKETTAAQRSKITPLKATPSPSGAYDESYSGETYNVKLSHTYHGDEDFHDISSDLNQFGEMKPLPHPLKIGEEEQCQICMNHMMNSFYLECGHAFCLECIQHAFKIRPSCPECGMVYGDTAGDQPKGGTMSNQTLPDVQVPGYEGAQGTIVIEYYFPGGFQLNNHPDPGKRYSKMKRTAYLPNNTEGRKVLKLLEKAFKAGLMFTFSVSPTNRRRGVITWNGIHHKTSLTCGPENNGYPDPDYLTLVKEELAAKGIIG